MRDAVLKYNVTRHASTKQLPFTKWYGHSPPLINLHAFGRVGTVHSKRDSAKFKKLYARSYPARYLYANSLRQITVLNLTAGNPHRTRTVDFVPYIPHQDPFASPSTTNPPPADAQLATTLQQILLPLPQPQLLTSKQNATPMPKSGWPRMIWNSTNSITHKSSVGSQTTAFRNMPNS